MPNNVIIQGALRDPEKCYIGTECWSAPEVLEGATITHKTDMFPYGLVLWYVTFCVIRNIKYLNKTEILAKSKN